MDIAFNMTPGRIHALSEVALRIDDAPPAYEEEHRADIARNWEEERLQKPALFDGRMFMFSRLAVSDGKFEGICHPVRYSTYLHWRRHGRGALRHCYANAILVTRDNALVAIEMAAHTLSAGSVYFASGSFEAEDAVDGRLDLEANMAREVGEEVGLDLSGTARENGYVALALDSGTAVARRFRLDLTASEAEAAIWRFLSSEDEPEIARPVIIREGEPRPARLAAQMPQLIDWHFANPFEPAG